MALSHILRRTHVPRGNNFHLSIQRKFCVTGEIEVVDTFKTLYYFLYSSQLINTVRKRCLHRVGSNWYPPWKQGENTGNRQCGSYIVYHCQKIAGELLI